MNLQRIMKEAEDGEWMTAEDIGAILKVQATTVRLWPKKGCPALRAGKRMVRFKLSEVRKWLENGT